MSTTGNPLVVQGNLNRVQSHVIVASNPALNATASNMAKSQVSLTFDSNFNDQVLTATGVVNSPVPYVQATLVINLLRSQALAATWLAQVLVGSVIGTVTVYPDSSAFVPVALSNCSVMSIDPGAYDGQDATVKITVRGTYYANASLWTGVTV